MKKIAMLMIPLILLMSIFAIVPVSASDGKCDTLWCYVSSLFSSMTGKAIVGIQDTGISSCADLQNMNNNLAGDYYLTQNIDCAETSGWNEGAGFLPVGNESSPFTGKLDGKGYKITGLYINRPLTATVGLFGCISSSSEIKNVGLINVNIAGRYYVGGLVGRSDYATISNSYATGSVSGTNYVGGLVGYNNNGAISNSYSTGTVSGSNTVGGLAGQNNYATISNSYATGSVSGSSNVGGLAGYNSGGSEGIISKSYSTGSVSGSTATGGLVGYNSGTTSNSFWDIQTSGQATSAGGTGKTTAEMQQQATYAGWDTNIWIFSGGYPLMQWQAPAVQDTDSDGILDVNDNCPSVSNPLQQDKDGIMDFAGEVHTCILQSNGNVHCYGDNTRGQAESYNGGDALGVATGGYHTCILKNNGNVDCYGLNTDYWDENIYYGQAEDYTGGNAIQVSTGYSYTCALLNNGNVHCWGDNAYGQAEDYLGGNAKQVSAGHYRACALLDNGNVHCWGYAAAGEITDYAGGDAIQVSAGAIYECILKNTGNVNCYGDNTYGQSVGYAGGDAIQVSAGGYHTCILKKNGNAAGWGWNAYGQSNPYNGGDAVQVSAGGYHTCILKNNGNVDCYGLDTNDGQANDYNNGDAVRGGDRIGDACMPQPVVETCGVNSTAGMISYWNFDSSDADDVLGSNNGVISGAVPAAGKVGGAYRFDGINDYINMANEPNFDFEYNQPFTLEAWININSLPDIQLILGKPLNAPPTWRGYSISYISNINYNPYASTDPMCFHLTGMGDFNPTTRISAICGGGVLNDNNWHHITVTSDGSGTATGMNIYVDGQLKEKKLYQDSLAGMSILNDVPFEISGRGNGNYAVNGTIDEVAVYNEALSQSEINQHYVNGMAGQPYCETAAPEPVVQTCGANSTEGMVSYWKADGTANDEKGINNGNIIGGVTYDAGKVGSAFSFDDTNKYIDITTNNFPFGNSPRTVEAWVKLNGCNRALPLIYGTTSQGKLFGLSFDCLYTHGISMEGYNFNYDLYTALILGGEWYHAALTFDGTTVTIYKNGEIIGSSTTTTGYPAGQMLSSMDTMSGSKHSIGGNWFNSNGLIDEVAVYNRALSESEINQHYVNGNAGQPYCAAAVPSQVCGNNILESPEVCDGTDLNSQTCQDIVPGTTGTLSCNAQCSEFITTQCIPVDSDSDTVPDLTDNCPTKYNPDQRDKDNQDGGDVCDVCPEDATDSCNPVKTGGEYIPQSGGDVTNQDNSLTVTVPAAATTGSSFAMQEAMGTDLTVKTGAVQLAAFNVEPSGAVFNQPVTLSAVVSTTALTQKQINSITFYMRRDDGTWTSYPTTRTEILGDGIGDNDGICEPNEKCTAQTSVTHFSVYAVGYLEELPECTLEQMLDLDGNGVVDINDAIHIMRYLTGQTETISVSQNCIASGVTAG